MKTHNGKPYRELRCTTCRKLLALEYIYSGRLSIKCYACNQINDIDCKAARMVLLEQAVKPTTYVQINTKGKPWQT